MDSSPYLPWLTVIVVQSSNPVGKSGTKWTLYPWLAKYPPHNIWYSYVQEFAPRGKQILCLYEYPATGTHVRFRKTLHSFARLVTSFEIRKTGRKHFDDMVYLSLITTR